MGLVQRPKPARLPEKLLQLRVALDLSQGGMLELLGMADDYDRSTISAYERGEREPPLPILLRYARSAGISTDVLIDDELDLPKKLPASQRTKGLSGKLQEQIGTPMDTIMLTLSLDIESKDKSSRSEMRARNNIEKLYLRRHGVKKLNDTEYELKFSYQDDEDLDTQVYELLTDIAREAGMHKCVIEVDVVERGTGRHW